MSTKKEMPGFTAEASVYKTRGHYEAGRHALNSSMNSVIPAIPMCRNCDYILDNCESNGWRPRGLCNMCAVGNCYDEPPLPNPFPDPFGPLPRF